MENILEHSESGGELNSCSFENSEENWADIDKLSPAPEPNEKKDQSIDNETVILDDAEPGCSESTNGSEPEASSEMPKNHHLDIDMAFDEDIILPSVRHDPEIEQKQRDRIKRKEIKSRKELEEEEREKMQ